MYLQLLYGCMTHCFDLWMNSHGHPFFKVFLWWETMSHLVKLSKISCQLVRYQSDQSSIPEISLTSFSPFLDLLSCLVMIAEKLELLIDTLWLTALKSHVPELRSTSICKPCMTLLENIPRFFFFVLSASLSLISYHGYCASHFALDRKIPVKDMSCFQYCRCTWDVYRFWPLKITGMGVRSSMLL